MLISGMTFYLIIRIPFEFEESACKIELIKAVTL